MISSSDIRSSSYEKGGGTCTTSVGPLSNACIEANVLINFQGGGSGGGGDGGRGGSADGNGNGDGVGGGGRSNV